MLDLGSFAEYIFAKLTAPHPGHFSRRGLAQVISASLLETSVIVIRSFHRSISHNAASEASESEANRMILVTS